MRMRASRLIAFDEKGYHHCQRRLFIYLATQIHTVTKCRKQNRVNRTERLKGMQTFGRQDVWAKDVWAKKLGRLGDNVILTCV